MFDRTFPPPGPGPKRVVVTITLDVHSRLSHRVVAEIIRRKLREVSISKFTIASIDVVDASAEIQEQVTKRWRKWIGADCGDCNDTEPT